MAGESPEYACGQILFNIKSSNLHYLVKEKHLSAFIAIRKKFIKPPHVTNKEDTIHVVKEKDVNGLDTEIRMENGLL